LIEDLGGNAAPGVGFALGVERLALLMEKEWKAAEVRKVYVAFMGAPAQDIAYEIARDLRSVGVICEVSFENKSLKSQLKRANKLNFSDVIILGEEELKHEKAQVKDFINKTQEEVPFDQLVSFFNK